MKKLHSRVHHCPLFIDSVVAFGKSENQEWPFAKILVLGKLCWLRPVGVHPGIHSFFRDFGTVLSISTRQRKGALRAVCVWGGEFCTHNHFRKPTK